MLTPPQALVSFRFQARPRVCPAGSGAGPLLPPPHPSRHPVYGGVDAGTHKSSGFCFQVGLESRKQRRVKLFKKLLANDAVGRVFTRTIPAIVCTVWDLSAFLVKLRVT